MSDHHDPFTPERIEEQIEHLAQAPHLESPRETAEQQMIRQLRGFYAPRRTEQRTQALERAWERITRTRAYQAQAPLLSPEPSSTPEPQSQGDDRDEALHASEARPRLHVQSGRPSPVSPPVPSLPARSRPAFRHLPALAALFLLVVLLGSLVLGLIADHHSQPGVAGPTIPPVNIYAGEGYNLIKLDARTGKQRWNHTIATSVDALPVVANGLVYLASFPGVYALDAHDASVRWHSTLPELDRGTTIPVVAGSVLYLGGSEVGTVYALDALTGQPLWHYRFPDQSDGQFRISDLTVVDGLVYGSEVHSVHNVDRSSFFALDASAGQLLWRVPAERGEFATLRYSAPVVSNGAAYVVSSVSQDGTPSPIALNGGASAVSVFNARTGHLLWRTPPSVGGVTTPLVVADGVVYFATTDVVSVAANGQILQETGTLLALLATTGDLLWRYQAAAELIISQQVLGGLLYVGSLPPTGNGTVMALSIKSGSVRWHWAAPSSVVNPLLVLGGALLVGSPASLYALDATTGAPIWSANSIIPIGAVQALVTVAP